MTSVWLTRDAHDRLRAELTELLATSSADADGQRRAARVRDLQELLASAVVGQDPADDGVAEPGMVLTVRYDDTGDEETFLLGLRDVEQGELEVFSPASPLGGALSGARPGEQRAYQVPGGGTVRVTLVAAVPYGRHRAAC